MAHEIDEMAPGVHAFVSARQDAWHRLGTTLDSTFTAEQAMEHAHLSGWDVRKLPLTTTEITEDGVRTIEIPDRFATVRTNPITKATEYLGVVGTQYTPIQNEEHAVLLNTLVDESGAHFETAGSLRGGRETFLTMKMPETMQVGGFDAVDQYLVALNSHDGTSAFRFLITPVRVVCANTQAAAIRGAKASFSIRHTVNASKAITEAREALGLTFKYLDEFQKAAEEMIAKEITEKRFKEILRREFGVSAAETERAKEQREKHVAGVMDLYLHADTNETIRGTKWGAYQAIVEYADHFMPAQGEDEAGARALRTIQSTQVQNLKHRAFATLSA